MHRALGISVHTGWAACVVVVGSLTEPKIIANDLIDILGDAERFCFHRAAEMPRAAAREWIVATRTKAIANARRELAPFLASGLRACAIVAKPGDPGDLDAILASHPRIHTAEGCFYRDVLREACGIAVRVISPAALDPARVGKLASAPWGRDQKLAALAAWAVIDG